MVARVLPKGCTVRLRVLRFGLFRERIPSAHDEMSTRVNWFLRMTVPYTTRCLPVVLYHSGDRIDYCHNYHMVRGRVVFHDTRIFSSVGYIPDGRIPQCSAAAFSFAGCRLHMAGRRRRVPRFLGSQVATRGTLEDRSECSFIYID